MNRLADKYLPEFHFSEQHSIIIRGTVEDVFKAQGDFDFRHYGIIRLLFKLRGIPWRVIRKEDLAGINFIELEKIYPTQLAIGLVGQFWKISGNLLSFRPNEFLDLQPEGYAKAVWTFETERKSDTEITLFTETRILCIGKKAKRSFGRYWLFIRPFSGLVRKIMLRGIKQIVEKKHANLPGDVPLQKKPDPQRS